MCKKPKNPNPSHGAGREERGGGGGGGEERKQAIVEELSRKLREGDPLAKVEAAKDIRKLARASAKARSAFAVPSVVDPLVSMLSSTHHLAKESSLLALLNLAVRNQRNKEEIVKSGAIPPLIELLKNENSSLRELATASVLTLSASASNRPTISASGAVPLLVQILISGSIQGRVDAVTALYNLSACEETSQFSLSVEATRPLLNLLKDCKKFSKFAEKATALLEILSQSEEGKESILVTDGGILILVETIEEGSLLSAEYAVGILLSLCRSCRDKYRDVILREGPVPGLLLLTVDGSEKAQDKARYLLKLLRDDCQMKRGPSEDLETIAYNIAKKVDGPEKAQRTAKRLLHHMVRRNMELNMRRIESRAGLVIGNASAT